jgi:hypothetical protein
VLDVYCDPDGAPDPPARHAGTGGVDGGGGGRRDPSAVHLMVQGAKEKLQELMPGRRD